jgi:hypothetical protein
MDRYRYNATNWRYAYKPVRNDFCIKCAGRIAADFPQEAILLKQIDSIAGYFETAIENQWTAKRLEKRITK